MPLHVGLTDVEIARESRTSSVSSMAHVGTVQGGGGGIKGLLESEVLGCRERGATARAVRAPHAVHPAAPRASAPGAGKHCTKTPLSALYLPGTC